MTYNYNPNQQSFNNLQIQNPQIQSLFPQPQGNVYTINSTLEVANVPIGADISVALYLQEGYMYIKTMQNRNPLFWLIKSLHMIHLSRHMKKIKDGIETYSNGRHRYKDGGSNERMVEGIEMTMCAIVDFIEALMDLAETSQEKEIVRKNIDKIKRI